MREVSGRVTAMIVDSVDHHGLDLAACIGDGPVTRRQLEDRRGATDWETFDLERPSPFALPLFAAFNREVLLAQDPDQAFEDIIEALYQA